jgi:DNA-binding IclR family transcriptional regulator
VAGGSAESGRSVASRVTAILLAFCSGGTHSLTEVARVTGLPVSTAHRLLGELTSRRVLERTADGNYRIGLPLRMIGEAHDLDRAALLHRAAATMADVAWSTGRPVGLGVLAGHRVLLGRVEPDRPGVGGFVSDVRRVLSTALGRVLLAFSPPGVVEEVLAAADEPRPDQVRRALRTVRVTRVAMRPSGDGSGAGSVAVPVFGVGGGLVCALEIDVPDLRTGTARAALIVAAGSLSREFASPAGPQRDEPEDGSGSAGS